MQTFGCGYCPFATGVLSRLQGRFEGTPSFGDPLNLAPRRTPDRWLWYPKHCVSGARCSVHPARSDLGGNLVTSPHAPHGAEAARDSSYDPGPVGGFDVAGVVLGHAWVSFAHVRCWKPSCIPRPSPLAARPRDQAEQLQVLDSLSRF